MVRRTQRGSMAVYLILSIGILMILTGIVWQSRQRGMAMLSFERSTQAYYAAEAGLQRALAEIEGGEVSGAFTGGLASGVYETVITRKTGVFRIVSSGYHYQGTLDAFKKMKQRNAAFGLNRNTLKVSGRLKDGRFVTESFEKIP